MLEVLEAIFKGFITLTRLFVEGGLLDVSLSATGRFVIRLLYPPHWFRSVTYPVVSERLIGILVWCALAYGVYHLECL